MYSEIEVFCRGCGFLCLLYNVEFTCIDFCPLTNATYEILSFYGVRVARVRLLCSPRSGPSTHTRTEIIF
jgi:hypothetical protein